MKLLIKLCLVAGLFTSSLAYAVVLPGLFDDKGKPVHTADEFALQVALSITKVPQGYQYSYSLQSSPSSLQDVWAFQVKLPAVDGVILNSTSSPWGAGGYPKTVDPLRDKYFPNLVYTPEMLLIGWAIPPIKGDPRLLVPSGLLSGFTFTSPYPPSMSFAYAEGLTLAPAFDVEPDSEDVSLPFDKHTPYGPGKVFPVIGPVKPITPNVTDNYSVIACTGGICDVQLDITGPQDPTGTAYTYTWNGAFGTATGAKPIVQLAAGAYTVSVAVSDPYATLVTATMPITVVDPNPPVVTPPVGGGNTGGGANQGGAGNVGNNQGGGAGQGTGSNAGNGNTGGNNQGVNGNVGTGSNDMDHDGITDDQDDDRDGDGKPNSEDLNPDHPD